MIHIHRIAKNDIVGLLPAIVPFDQSRTFGTRQIDLVICTAGFEDRATALADELNGCNVSSLLILRYQTNVGENEKSLSILRGVPANHIVEVMYDRADFRRSLRATFEKLINAKDVFTVIDISVMSSYLLYPLFEELLEYRLAPHVAVFYAEAINYHPSKEEWDRVRRQVSKVKDSFKRAARFEKSGFQSLGVDAIYESDKFPGSNISALPTQVLAVPNFSRTRMRQMLAFAESQYNASIDDVAWLIGQPPDRELNGWRFDAMKELCDPIDRFASVCTRDYKNILWYLLDFWEELAIERHMVIAPLGSKMQHLGIFLFLKMRPDTGLLLSEPRAFLANKYSAGIGKKWWIDFGSSDQLQSLLASYGNLEFHWE